LLKNAAVLGANLVYVGGGGMLREIGYRVRTDNPTAAAEAAVMQAAS